MDFDFAQYQLIESRKENTAAASPSREAYKKLRLETPEQPNRNPCFQEPAICSNQWFLSEFFTDTSFSHLTKWKQQRYISQTAERTMDAPDLVDDYYLNLFDWGSNDVLSIALGNTIHLWSASNGSASELVTDDEDIGPVTSIYWAPEWAAHCSWLEQFTYSIVGLKHQSSAEDFEKGASVLTGVSGLEQRHANDWRNGWKDS